MSRFLALAVAVLGSVQEDAALREALRGYVHPWSGFLPGSRLVINETTKASAYDSSRNATVFKEKTVQYVWTVRSVSEERATIRIEGGGQEGDITVYLARPGIFRGKAEPRGEAEIAVGERRYRCSAVAIVLDADKEAGQVTTIWRCPEAPSWAVRVLVETFIRGKRNTWEEELLVEADRKLSIEGREVPCQVVQVTTGSEGGGRTVKKEWRSDAVPGRVARREVRHYSGDREIEGASVKMEVVSFEARR